jgi:hypothetical protein
MSLPVSVTWNRLSSRTSVYEIAASTIWSRNFISVFAKKMGKILLANMPCQSVCHHVWTRDLLIRSAQIWHKSVSLFRILGATRMIWNQLHTEDSTILDTNLTKFNFPCDVVPGICVAILVADVIFMKSYIEGLGININCLWESIFTCFRSRSISTLLSPLSTYINVQQRVCTF